VHVLLCNVYYDAVLLLYNSSSNLTTRMQPVIGLSTLAFSFVFELYVQSHDHITTSCSSGAQLTLVLCDNMTSRQEVVLHLGINGTERSELRQAILSAGAVLRVTIAVENNNNSMKFLDYTNRQ